ncbi:MULTISPECIES: SRPBCC family protein [Rhizobium/Agrobacterium group]|uniref:SRPBCC family protein n=1 Tax=Rhizobium/Agrobacterium group TaxID=227290 RepID=UPI000FD8A0DB|nr:MULTISPECIES: SRPBCC family protein [Rhizobium/Agrobacterium group]MBB4402183.1 uncharacterized protein YndB with AHSA1/START domain [Agrobacterium radiobacter]MBB5588337.1 uncharacterized protein YndB with AHSA1/START domain [Agrobacterium radiobacter]RVT74649.1 polyketide cyclase [Agrobacterium sp. CNPSo 2736]TGE89472.1 polyketide cyclase [Rhizobium sp. SEMIA 4032]
MTETFNPDLDLKISRIIRAPRRLVWNAWTDKASLEQWWVPHPGQCRVDSMELHPGGAFETRYSEDGTAFGPHVKGCFLAVDHEQRLVFTDALTAGFRPSAQPFLTAVMTFRDHPDGMEYVAYAMHNNLEDRDRHAEMGFFDGWNTVAEQLAQLVERQAVN